MRKLSRINPKRLKARMDEFDFTQEKLGAGAGCDQATIGRLLDGTTASSKYLPNIAEILETTVEFLTDMTDDPSRAALIGNDISLIAEQLDLVQVQKIDLELGLGGTYTDSPVQIEMVSVSRGWLAMFTTAAPKNVFIAQCRGNSMQPTINDGDWIIGNTNKTRPKSIDDIWVITLYGLSGVKRLRPIENGYKILSDNQTVPDEIATDGEMSIIGRVEAIIKRV